MRGGEKLLLASFLACLVSCAASSPSLMPERRGGLVHFQIEAPGATRVTLVGSFNEWNPAANPMSTRDGRLWEAAVALGSGRHVYAFLVDDRPCTPPSAPLYEDDGFGGRNGVIEVP